MATKKTMVVPCMVNMRLKTCGRNKMIVGNGKLNAHDASLRSRHNQKEQRIDDIHQAELLVIDRSHPIVQGLEPSPSYLPSVELSGRGILS